MKKLLFTSLLSLGLLLPVSLSASTNSATSTTEFSSKKPKKQKGKTTRKKSRKSKRSKARSTRSYSQSRGCTYNGHPLSVGPRGGCYYYSGNSKEYVDRSYCSGCN
ncbi:hypothetical protein SAMN05421664_1692 [Chryseobacterium soldanellicola]|uniref:PBCV-specific basic adaptor domain-containing protein n=1 Tax=Chryseobacterium soldanellicola TaxID=311333 RepID=A0A1H1B2S9_9FLAO|nr:hypothetical protein [Chryseobacterium soldanellicola]SDQ46230.1 hypothetical protein SAMN05421664_1692 [Chryseobacterium soldanellicola]